MLRFRNSFKPVTKIINVCCKIQWETMSSNSTTQGYPFLILDTNNNETTTTVANFYWLLTMYHQSGRCLCSLAFFLNIFMYVYTFFQKSCHFENCNSLLFNLKYLTIISLCQAIFFSSMDFFQCVFLLIIFNGWK